MSGLSLDALPERFRSKIEVRDDGCWEWRAATFPNGYGAYQHGRKCVRAHRYAFEELIGPIPAGLHLDHTCHDGAVCLEGIQCPHRRCVNPLHLEPVTAAENALRGNRVLRPRCLNGHEWTDESTYYIPGRGVRHCRICVREHGRSYRMRQRSAKGTA